MKNVTQQNPDLTFTTILVMFGGALTLFALVVLLSGCGVATVAGDDYSTAVRNEGGPPTWARTVENEKWCEWFYPNFPTAKSPWCVIAYDLTQWNDWVAACAARKILAPLKDEIEVKVTEPRAKWIRYDSRAAWENVR